MPTTKIRKEQLRLTLQDIFDLNQQHNGSWTVSIPNYNTLKITNDIYEYEFTSNNGLIVGSSGSKTVKINDSGVFYKSGSNYLEYLRDVTAGTGIAVSGTNVKTISVNLSAGTGISISGATITNTDRGSSQNIFKNIANSSGSVQFSAGSNNDTIQFGAGGIISVSFDGANKRITYSASLTAGAGIDVNGSTISAKLSPGTGISISGTSTLTISVASPTARTDTAQTWTQLQTFNGGISIPSQALASTNLGFVTTEITTLYQITNTPSVTRYSTWNGTQGYKFKYANFNQVLVFLNGQLLKGAEVSSGWSAWPSSNPDYIFEPGDSNGRPLSFKEPLQSGDILLVVGVYSGYFV